MSEQHQSLDGVEVHLVETMDDANRFLSWLGQRRDVLGVDTETGGLRWWRDDLRLAQFGDAMTGWAIPWGDWAGLVKESLRRYDGDMVMHNMKFDLHYLEYNGVQLDRRRVHDTRVQAHLLDPTSSTGLKPLSSRYIHPRATAGEQMLKEAMGTNKWTWATVPVNFDPYWQYGALDTVLTARLHGVLRSRVSAGGLDAVYDLERGSTLVLADMERRGARVDLDYCRTTREKLLDYVAQVKEWAKQLGVANINSAMQVWSYLEAQGIEPTKFTPSGRPKLDEEVLESISHPLAEAVHAAKKAQKMVSSYFDSIIDLADGDLIHCSTNPLGARTGRMSISDPPLQQLPRGEIVRNAFIARDEHDLVLVDYDQMELRVFAYYAQEQGMIDAARNGIDLHNYIGGMVFNVPMDELTKPQRQITKGVNFGIPYGAGEATIARTSDRSLQETREFLMKYHELYPGVKKFFAFLEHAARKRLAEEGEAYVRTWAGRRQPAEKDKLYTLVNYLIQGGCADLLKQKLIDLDREGLAQYLILPVHDEVISDVPKDVLPDAAHAIAEVMTERVIFDPMPLTASADVYPRWGAKYVEAG